nr:plasmid recombination protein [Candidatus Soleaferrea massiliensis]
MVGKGSLTHNNRDFIAENIDRSRTADNITYLHEDLRTVYTELFGAALERYNAKQKRSDRKIADYYEHIRTGKQEKLFHEVIFQIGSVKNTAVGTPEGEQAKAVLDEFMCSFQERNPHLRVFSAHLHMDEATPHLHIDFVPFTTDSKRGLDTRVSMKKALAAQGFEGGSRGDTEFNQWINAEKQTLAQVMERHGIEWEQLGTHNEHLSVLDFKKQERQAEVMTLEQSIAKLQKQQVDIKAVENIDAKNVPLSSKVMLERQDYQMLLTAAQKYVVQEKKSGRLEKLLKAAEKTIADLKTKLAGVIRERDELKSIRSQLNVGKLEQENCELRQSVKWYQSVLEQQGLSHMFGKQKQQRQVTQQR